MELDQLRAFLAVVEAGGFSRAAQVIASTQPTLSRQVKALEGELGQPLFDRLGNRVALTSFGQDIAKRARSLLAEADALVGSGHTDLGRVTGELRLGVADSVVFKRLPPILAAYQRRHPDVTLHIKTAGSPEILAWVREDRVDVGVCMLPQAYPGLVLHPHWEDGFMALVQPCHELADTEATLAAFAAHRQLVISPRMLSFQVLSKIYQDEGLSLVPAMDFDNFHLVAEFVAAGVGVGVCSTSVAEAFVRKERVARVRIEPLDRLNRKLGLALHADRTPSGALAALLESFEHEAAKGKNVDAPVAAEE